MRVRFNRCIIAEKERSGEKNTCRFSTLLLMGYHAMYFFTPKFQGIKSGQFHQNRDT